MSENLDLDLAYINSVTDKSKGVGLGFAKRDKLIKEEEDEGLIEFLVIFNDRTHDSMKYLIDLKNIFSKQLPKMPKEYIVRLMFNEDHHCMIILKNKKDVVGGICYRIFEEDNFSEVVFLAISPNEQVKGYGTRLMNKYKDKMQQQNIKVLLTYADNYAIGYFKKQGFNKEIMYPELKWKGRIKDYEGGTLMECHIHEIINYNKISKHIAKQKEWLIKQIKNLCINEKVFPGLKFDQVFIREDLSEIPGLSFDLLDTTNETSSMEIMTKSENYFMQCQNILSALKKMKSSWPFLEPVNGKHVIDYYDIIKEPIDMRTIEDRLIDDYYKEDKQLFAADIRRMFANAKIYNQEQTIYYKCAEELSSSIEPIILDFLQRN